MKPAKYESLWIGSVYFLILVSIALWVRDIPNQLDVFSSIQQIIDKKGLGDPTYFARAAVDVANTGWVSHSNRTMFVFNLWPPGFVLLEAFLLKIFGMDGPIILAMQVLAAALFACVLVHLYELLRTYINHRAAFVLPLLIFAFPVSRVTLLEPTGITLGESFAVGFFLLGVLLALRSVERNLLRYAVYAGLCIALAAYFRSQFELILQVLTGWGGLLIVALMLVRLRNTIGPEYVKSTIKTLAVLLLVAHAATIPWRAYHWVKHGSAQWVMTTELTFPVLVMSTEYLEKTRNHIVVAGRGNIVCILDATTCNDAASPEEAKRQLFKTFLSHPIEWYSVKFESIGNFWFSPVKYWVVNPDEPTLIDIVANGVLLIALMALVVLLLIRKVRSHGLWILLMWFNLSIFSAYAMIFTLVHLEVRYFYFPKIAGIVMLLIVAGLYCRQTKNIDNV